MNAVWLLVLSSAFGGALRVPVQTPRVLAPLTLSAPLAPMSSAEAARQSPLFLPLAPAPRVDAAPALSLAAPEAPRVEAASSVLAPLDALLPEAKNAEKDGAKAEATLSARFDGARLVGRDGAVYEAVPTIVSRAGGGRTEVRVYRSPAGQLALKRSFVKGRYEASEGAYKASFRLEGGVLRGFAETRKEGGASVLLNAKKEFANALELFGRGVKAVESPAADAEWAGKQAAKAGFTQVLRASEGKVFFVRPEDARRDRTGGLWRRLKEKDDKLGGRWELFEKDGRSVWVLHRKVGDGEAIYEYEGPEMPAAGTPAPHLAVFSVKEGTLFSHIDTRGSSLLNAKAEFRAQIAKRSPSGIKGTWTFGDNLAEFNRLTGAGMSAEEAALKTWTGQRAAEAGFTKVAFSPVTSQKLRAEKPGAYSAIAVLFEKP